MKKETRYTLVANIDARVEKRKINTFQKVSVRREIAVIESREYNFDNEREAIKWMVQDEASKGACCAADMFKVILSMLPDQPRSFDTSDDPGYWTNGAEILCPTETECEIVADFLEDLFKGYGEIKMHTGYYDPDEDRRSGEMDDNTGFYYIDFDD